MLSGGRTQFVALKAKMPWLDINQERHYAYAGYEGMVELVREIDKALSNPVWRQVRTPAPWDEVAGNSGPIRQMRKKPQLLRQIRRRRARQTAEN